MTVALDASVIVAALIDSGAQGKWAESVISSQPLVSPELVMVETTNILRRLERRGDVSRLEATSSQRDLLRLDLELFPFAPFSERIWALRDNVTSYDAWYVAVAEVFDCPLATLDRKLTDAPGVMCEFLTP
ncbi:MAG: type II toxin-antitoxin system VapC family toxin [Gammaproteobacteria bacterium]|nr:type II toxin-antitoxin system VapC family toxin [Gammaproteobacteria bacterium]